MRGDERLEDLAADVYETVFEAPGVDRVDVLLGHSLAALISLELCRKHGEPEAGHSINRDSFEGYVGILGRWLGGPKA